MPLPRFDRLPADARASILTVARTHFARDGKDAASFNQIIAEAGISKTSAYHYFDGKDDLFGAVVADAGGRTLTALGPWADVATGDELWEQVAAGTTRLVAHLREHPDDRAVLAEQPYLARDSHSWIHRLVANGLRIGLIDPFPGVELTTVTTVGVFDALDTWALDHPGEPGDSVADTLTLFLARLWNTAPGDENTGA
ncbi:MULTISPECIES: TetR/AcrR family transcriptional regulator [unclassified Streptosporangium]|uniref:TetR/AcrR family transcriptional regulator n=1 Tax=unclassified Streptosporangium TaxID=2632669 RepID=UPI002E2A82A1|nr:MULTISPECIES: TetR/AcrR family transcriptional regulator [unclassified Streptosporangium]